MVVITPDNLNMFVTKRDLKNRWYFIPEAEAERFDKMDKEAFEMNDISILEGTYYKFQIRDNIRIFIEKPKK